MMSTKDPLEYAWMWFEYHAGQRLATFRFFLVLLGALVAALVAGANAADQYPSLARALAAFGAFVSLAFFFLELRNERLVDIGRDALSHIEKTDPVLSANAQLQLVNTDRGPRRKWWLSYKFWCRAIYLLSFLLLTLAAYDPNIVFGHFVGAK